MPQVASDADQYAHGRVGIFFPAHNQTSADGNLTGQCVTLIKWFMAEMSSVPAPFSARGDARYVGKTLVNQGHAVQVPASERRRGDIVVWEYGVYGHIAVLLSGDRVFEQNVGIAGTASRIVDGARVYASRIDPLYMSWRPVAPTFYRLKSYNEKAKEQDIVKPTEADVYYAFRRYANKEPDNPEQVQFYMNRDIRDLYFDLLNYEVVPKKAEVEKAFKELQWWSPINTPPYTDQTGYYTSHAGDLLYSDLAIGLKKKLEEALSKPDANYKDAGTVDGKPVYRKVE